jgi:hypothetical protein
MGVTAAPLIKMGGLYMSWQSVVIVEPHVSPRETTGFHNPKLCLALGSVDYIASFLKCHGLFRGFLPVHMA